MKKILYALAGLTFCVALTHNAHATDLVQTNAGDPVSIATASNPDFDDFNPSVSVAIDGVSQSSQFAIGSYHIAVLGKKSGKAFGMASDASNVFYLDISADDATAPTVTTSDTSAFSTYTAM